jgi:hypothetical protein
LARKVPLREGVFQGHLHITAVTIAILPKVRVVVNNFTKVPDGPMELALHRVFDATAVREIV